MKHDDDCEMEMKEEKKCKDHMRHDDDHEMEMKEKKKCKNHMKHDGDHEMEMKEEKKCKDHMKHDDDHKMEMKEEKKCKDHMKHDDDHEMEMKEEKKCKDHMNHEEMEKTIKEVMEEIIGKKVEKIMEEKGHHKEKAEEKDKEKCSCGNKKDHEHFDDYEKQIEKIKEDKYGCKDKYKEDEKKYKDMTKELVDDLEYPLGNMGEFFKGIIKGLEKIGANKNMSNCLWYKAHINKIEDMYCMYDYNKYAVVYYPMVCYYPYISRHKHFMIGYKWDNTGRLKHIIYAIPGTKSIEDQPYGGKTGFVTFMPSEKNEDEGHWLMYYDIKANTVVVPMKRN